MSVDETLESKLYQACSDGNIEDVIKLLQNTQINTNWQQQNDDLKSPFYIACEKGHIEVVKLLLNDNRVDINKASNGSDWTPFLCACYYGNYDNGKTGLDWARAKGNIDIVNLIEPFHHNQSETGTKELAIGEIQVQLYQACSDGKTKEVQELLQNSQININWQDFEYPTPLYIACQNGQIEIVKLLLSDNRVDINEPLSFDGEILTLINTKLSHLIGNQNQNQNQNEIKGHVMISYCWEEKEKARGIANYLQSKNIPIWIDFEQMEGNSLDKMAEAVEESSVILIFLSSKYKESQACRTEAEYANRLRKEIIYIMAEDNYQPKGWLGVLLGNNLWYDLWKIWKNPFYIACEKGHIEIVKILLNDKRISIRKKTNGKTAIDIAKEENHSHIVKLIQEFDTEQRYQEYLETFQSTPFFCIENETINERDFPTLIEHLKKNNNITELRFQNCGLTPSILLEILKILLSKSENGELSNIQNIRIDNNIKLESTEGLEIIPIEIRNQGPKSIIQYILDLYKSNSKPKPDSNTNTTLNSNPNPKPISISDSLYRTKLMVVGYENVGKTTILDCLFPIQDIVETKGFFYFLNTEYRIELQGKYLRKYKPKELNKDYEEIIIENKGWRIKDINESELGLLLLKDKTKKMIIYFKDQGTKDKWSERLKRVTRNSATHGIEIQDQILQNRNKSNTITPNINVSIWDFAGQHEYYNNHHYFLSARSVFLVLWKIKDEKNRKSGLEGLNFWFKSLSSHLKYDLTLTDGKLYFSIIVVGTFLDDQSVDQSKEAKKLRERKIEEIAKSNGIDYPIQIYEVSCSTLENIDELKQDIYEIALTHGYMGEKLPIGYLDIKNSIEKLRNQEKFKNFPIISLQELIEECKANSSFEYNEDFVKRGLKLLHQWGTCIYFDEPRELSNDVVLKPEFLSQEIMGKLFSPDLRHNFKDGILNHSKLEFFWPDYMDKAENLMLSMEKFEICFKLKEDERKPFKDQRSLIVSYLPEDKPNDLSKYWPTLIPRKEIEIERIFSFNQVPSEMVSRLLVRFHQKIVDNIIWRRGVLLKHDDKSDNRNENEKENILCLLEVKMSENLFEIKIRGKERKECLEMMKYIYEEVKIVSGNYGGVKWKECVRSPHFSKALIDLNDIKEDCKLELKDRKLICPITHFPIYGEDLLFKTGLLDSLDNQNNIRNGYWNYTYENQNQQNQQNEPEPIFEKSEILNQREYEKVEYLLKLFGFDISKVDKIFGSENKNWKRSFEAREQQIYGLHKDTPNLFKKEDWIEQSEAELRKSMIQYLGDYISKFRNVGWNHGNNSFVIPMIQGTSEDAAWRICDNGFGTACTLDAGYYAQGVYITSKAKYAAKYNQKTPKVFVIGFVMVGNPFPVIEHPFDNDKPINPGYQFHFALDKGKVILHEIKKDKSKKNKDGYSKKPINSGYQCDFTLDEAGKVIKQEIKKVEPKKNENEYSDKLDHEEKEKQEIKKVEPKKNENGYLGKPINPGYQCHFTLVDGRNMSGFPITEIEQLKEEWVADELVVQESSQIYPSYIIYYN